MKVPLKQRPDIVWIKVIGISSGFVLHKEFPSPSKALFNLVNGPQVPKPRAAKSYSDALKISKETGRPLILMFKTNKCEWCKKMEQTLKDSRVKSLVSEYVFYCIDWSKNKHLCGRYDVVGFPTYRLIAVINDQEMIVKTGFGYKTPEAFMEWIVAEKA